VTTAYQRGHKAGVRGDPPELCPYAGGCAGSRMLRRRWLEGHFDGSFNVKRRYDGRKIGKTYRKLRKRLPRSEYARRRVVELLTVSIR